MTLYTAMPLELVFEGFQSERPPLVTIRKDGIVMQVEPIAPGTGKIVRLLHCELYKYLDARYAPGAVVSYFAEGGDSPNH